MIRAGARSDPTFPDHVRRCIYTKKSSKGSPAPRSGLAPYRTSSKACIRALRTSGVTPGTPGCLRAWIERDRTDML